MSDSEARRLFDLSGRVAIVTGGGTGIGLGISRGLAAAGATVVISSRRAEAGAEAVASIETEGGKAAVLPADIRDPDACRRLVDDTVQRFGRVDILVNNSGVNYRKQPQEFTLEDWSDVIDTNLRSAFLLSQAVYPHYVRQGGGKIIMVSSIAAQMAAASQVAYSPSKAGMVQLARTLAVAWAKDNIQANAVLPGWIDTPLSQRFRASFPEAEAAVTSRTPAGRWGDPSDFAGPAVFLASSASDFVNGAALPVDGGYSVQA
jgi:2-deoxy-D-gluconate 3-dehydrogenase